IKNSRFWFHDLFYFVGKKNEVLTDNKNSIVSIDGNISGNLNQFTSNYLKVDLDKKVYFGSKIKVNDISDVKDMAFELKNLDLKANVPYVQKFLRHIDLGDKIPRFGNVKFKGDLEGNLSLNDVLIKGVFKTDLGISEVDLNTQFDKKLKKIFYKGLLTLKNFDAGLFLDQPQLGKVGGKVNLVEGQDLFTDNPKVKLSGVVDSLIFKGYNYRDININGIIDSRKFDGNLGIKDPNIDLQMKGLIDFQDSIPIFNLSASVNSLALQKLKLSKRGLMISGLTSLDFMGANPDDFEGYIRLKNISISDNDEKIVVDSVNISSILNDNGERYLDFDSDYGTMYFDGEYKLKDISQAVQDIFIRHFGKFTKGFIDKDTMDKDFEKYYYDFSAEINNSKSLLRILTGEDLTFNNFNIHGSADHKRDSLIFDVNVDELRLKNHHLSKFYSTFNLYQGYGDLHIESQEYGLNKLNFAGINFDSDVDGDELYFQLAVDTIAKNIASIAFSGRTEPLKDSLAIEVYGGFFNAFKNELQFSGQNRIVIGKDYLNIEDFVLNDNNGRISFEDYNDNKGLKLNIKNIDIGIVDLLIKYKNLNFKGLTSGFVSVPNVFNANYVEGNIETPNLKINDDSYGSFKAKMKIDSLDKSKLTYTANLGDALNILSARGFYNLKERIFFGDYYLNEFPLVFLEYIINDGIKGTQGTVDGNLRVYGPFKNISITGSGIAHNGQTTVDYLGVTYFFNNQKFVLNEKGIDFTGVEITDRFGNKGQATGGITYERFLHWGVDVNLTSDKIMALNTTKEQNPDYWGVGVGKVNASFKGKFEDIIHMNIAATTARGSNLTIPVKLYVESDDRSFVKFGKKKVVSKKEPVVQKQAKFDVELNVNVTPEAEMTIIMDENAGDNLTGKGEGKIRLLVKEDSDIEMYGDFKFLEGKYLFTLYKVVNKEFTIREGSSILWSGDPFDARLDITADYPGNKVSLKNFLSEYAEIKNANYKADVDLIMLLGGSLSHPDINFDFNFRNEDEKLKTYIVSKMQRLKSDVNSLNTQVVGIMVFGSFLPDENISNVIINQPISTTGQSAFYNTVSEFVVTKLSGYLTGLLSEVLSDSDVISGIDISLNSESNTILSTGQSTDVNSYMPQYFNLNATLWFFDNKLKIEFGSGYTGKSDISPKSNFFSGENVNMEFFLTEDKRLKVKMFFNRDYNEIIGQWEVKSGLGLGYGREFGKIYKNKK
ncbi:MAG TPA: hypothetical protein ENK91_10420, partial [Bacteroidetes bacterium]|nr:hypothetical protein [Bacteroidota bacterium]